MVEIAIIGAGAAGIITARQLIAKFGATTTTSTIAAAGNPSTTVAGSNSVAATKVRISIFERRTTIGGAWQLPSLSSSSSASGYNNNHNHHYYDNNYYPQMWDTLVPNLSKYTCTFSDNIVHPNTTTTTVSTSLVDNNIEMFPSLQQMNQYLNDYTQQYIVLPTNDNVQCTFHYGCTVTRISKSIHQNHHKQNEQQQEQPLLLSPFQYEVQWKTTMNNDDNSNNSNDDNGCIETNSGVTTTQHHTKVFDGVVMATGFFSKPIWWWNPNNITNSNTTTTTSKMDIDQQQVSSMTDKNRRPTSSSSPATLIHSSQYRSSIPYRNMSNIAIIGNSFSAHEIISDIIFGCSNIGTTSSINNSTTTVQQQQELQHKPNIIHITGTTIPYVVPRNIVTTMQLDQSNNNSPNEKLTPGTATSSTGTVQVVPIDTILYRRTSDITSLLSSSSSEIPPEIIHMDETSCHQKHMTIRKWIGLHKLQQAKEKGYDMLSSDTSIPPHLSISDHYLDLVIDDQIQVITGSRMKSVSLNDISTGTSSSTKYTIELENGATLPNIDAIICCTGYQCTMHEILDDDILNSLQYDPKHDTSYLPYVACYDTILPMKLPNFGMIGMYKGPYFGIMELQAKLYATTFQLPNDIKRQSLLDSNMIHNAYKVSETRRQMTQNKNQRRPQFPHFDYIGMMDQLSQACVQLDKEINSSDDTRSTNTIQVQQRYKKGIMVSPRLYRTGITDIEIQQYANDMNEEIQLYSSKNIAKTVLSSLIGNWTFNRIITDTYTQSTQHITGTIRYSINTNYDGGGVRYREDGLLTLPNGKHLEVFREYDYISDENGYLEIMFVENGIRTYRFLQLKFTTANNNAAKNSNNGYDLTATSDHLCVKDLYEGTFQIQLDGCSAKSICITYNVQGPKKDYVSVTTLYPTL